MKYFQEKAETMPLEEIRRLQSEKLVKQVRHVYDHVEPYRRKMDEKGVRPEDIHGIEDLHKLPFLTKSDLRDEYPWGLLAVPQNPTASASSPPAAPPAAGWWPSIPSMTWISGRSAAPGR